MKTRHDGDCSIYFCLDNKTPENGICMCGYGRQQMRKGNYEHMYSSELQAKLTKNRTPASEKDLASLFKQD